MRTFALWLAAAVAVAGTTTLASAQAYYPTQHGPRYVNPDYQPYGPGYYVGPRHAVPVPRGCYASREQVRINGQLVWRPLVTCPYDESR
jgi:hypothetical protein